MPSVTVVITRSSAGAPARAQHTSCQAATALEALSRLEGAGAVLSQRREAWALRPGVTVFLNGADLRLLGGLQRRLADGDVLAVVTPVTDT